jgi:hypothetical protein
MKPEEPRKAYATLQSNGTVTLDELSDHIRKHGSVYSEGTILGVLKDMVVCTREALLEGNYVEFGSLGKLKLSISSDGASAGVDKDGNPITALQAFNESYIKELNVIFEPGKGLQWNLDEDVDFEFTISRKAQAAAKKAAKNGETSADWGEEEEEEDGD